MSKTLEQLRKEWNTPCPSLTSVRERYFSHISTNSYLLRRINAGHIALKVTRLGDPARGAPAVYLHDLASYLDAQNPPPMGHQENEEAA